MFKEKDYLIVVRISGEEIMYVGMKELQSFDLTFPDFKLSQLKPSEETLQVLNKLVVETRESERGQK